MKWLLALPLLLGTSLPAGAQESVAEEASTSAPKEHIYLVIKTALSTSVGEAIAMQVIPMGSIEQCEEAGALVTTSNRFRVRGSRDGFECVSGGK